jgi:hypothetical protein
MTDIPTRIEVNCTTGEVSEIPLTPDEISQREIFAAETLARQAAEEADALRVSAIKESARSKLVSGEPLTVEEASTVVL